MGEYQNVNLAIEDRTAIITIDHPPANSFDTQTTHGSECCLRRMPGQSAGQGDHHHRRRQFCSWPEPTSTTIAKLGKQGYEATYDVVRAGQVLFNKIEQSPKPVIAAINGSLLPGRRQRAGHGLPHPHCRGFSVQFGQPEIKLGIMPGWGGTQRLAAPGGQGHCPGADPDRQQHQGPGGLPHRPGQQGCAGRHRRQRGQAMGQGPVDDGAAWRWRRSSSRSTKGWT